jgi:hypothetical protein
MTVHLTSKDYVQTADATTNIEERDVVGNKTDAAAAGAVSATESLMAYSKQNVTNTEAILVDTATTIPATIATVDANVDTLLDSAEKIVATSSINLGVGNTNIFTVSGLVEIVSIIGTVDTTFKVVANNTKITAGGGVLDICAVVDITGAAQFSSFSITGTFADAMIINVGGAWEAQAGNVAVGPGSITVNCAGDDDTTGLVTWYLTYKAISSGASVAAA